MGERPQSLDYREPDWVADRLGLDKNTVYKFLHDGTIPAIQLGRKWLISEARLADWLRQETDTQTRARRESSQSAERTVQRLDNFTASARLALKHAHSEARRHSHEQLGQLHLLLGLAADPQSSAARALGALGINPAKLRQTLAEHLPQGATPPPRRLGRSLDAKRAMRLATKLAARRSPESSEVPLIGTDHLLTGLLLSRQGPGYELLVSHKVSRQRLGEAMRQVKQTSSNKE